MNVLVACEYSGRVREAFRRLGHNAWSCDLLPSEDNSPHHLQTDALQVAYGRTKVRYLPSHTTVNTVEVVLGNWDLMICHPPCTHLAISGARRFVAKQASGVQQEALDFVKALLDALKGLEL